MEQTDRQKIKTEMKDTEIELLYSRSFLRQRKGTASKEKVA